MSSKQFYKKQEKIFQNGGKEWRIKFLPRSKYT